jgi:hypothetical protein
MPLVVFTVIFTKLEGCTSSASFDFTSAVILKSSTCRRGDWVVVHPVATNAYHKRDKEEWM